MKRVIFIFVLLLTTAMMASTAISGLKIADSEECRTTGECEFHFQIVDENGAWDWNTITEKAYEMTAQGEFKYKISIETGDDSFNNSLIMCIFSGVCSVEENYISFVNNYAEGGWYNVNVGIENSDTGHFGVANLHHSLLLHRPLCLFKGSKSEGWYWEDTVAEDRQAAKIQYAVCSESTEPECENFGWRSEGWYADQWTGGETDTGRRIAWDFCHRTVGFALEGESCGPGVAKCYGDNLICEENVCVKDEPVCLIYETVKGSENTVYAVNFKNRSEAIERLNNVVDENNHPIYLNEQIHNEPCGTWAENNPVLIELYAPVCGSSDGEKSRVFHIVHALRRNIAETAGNFGENRGAYVKGECGERYCVSFEKSGSYTAANVKSKDAAEELLASSGEVENGAVLEGTCRDQGTMCPLHYMPVCGEFNGKTETHSNLCGFKVAVRTEAGMEGNVTGKWQSGACTEKCYNNIYYGDLGQCAAMRFVCPDNGEAFWDDKGCGCKFEVECGEKCYQKVHYGNRSQCAAMTYTCPEGSRSFWDDEGCGCEFEVDC